MTKLLSCSEIKELDSKTIENKEITSLDLMSYAVLAVEKWIINNYRKNQKFSIICGNGNNGADGILLSCKLMTKNYKVQVYYINEVGSPEFSHQFKYAKSIGLHLEKIDFDNLKLIDFSGVIIDCIFGVGLNREITGNYLKLINLVNSLKKKIISIDTPSGISADTYFSSNHIIPDKILTFHVPKLTFFFSEYLDKIKNIEVLDIGLDNSEYKRMKGVGELIDINMVTKKYKPRKKTIHKGDCGHALLFAGSEGKYGASILCGKSLFRTGAGLLTFLCDEKTKGIIYKSLPEAMTSDIITKDNFSISSEIKKYKVIGIGPGLGISKQVIENFKMIINEVNYPVVVDADGLNILSEHKNMFGKLPKESILTPHIGEFKRIAGNFKNSNEKIKLQRIISKKYGINVLLKGPYTTMTDSKGELYINTSGNSGLATAGSGDVLTGIITALLAQNYTPFNAMIIGAFLHGLSADIAVKKSHVNSLIASDIIENLSGAFNHIERNILKD